MSASSAGGTVIIGRARSNSAKMAGTCRTPHPMNQPKSPTPVNRLSKIAITPVTATVITAFGLNRLGTSTGPRIEGVEGVDVDALLADQVVVGDQHPVERTDEGAQGVQRVVDRLAGCCTGSTG